MVAAAAEGWPSWPLLGWWWICLTMHWRQLAAPSRRARPRCRPFPYFFCCDVASSCKRPSPRRSPGGVTLRCVGVCGGTATVSARLSATRGGGDRGKALDLGDHCRLPTRAASALLCPLLPPRPCGAPTRRPANWRCLERGGRRCRTRGVRTKTKPLGDRGSRPPPRPAARRYTCTHFSRAPDAWLPMCRAPRWASPGALRG